MGLTVCPAAVVAAPVEVVWENLVQWERYSEWADVQAERSEPEGPATIGQTINFTGKAFGRTLHFIFKVEEVNPERSDCYRYLFQRSNSSLKRIIWPVSAVIIAHFRRHSHRFSPFSSHPENAGNSQ